MIRFGCEYCAYKISVQDKHAGKRVKCPKCGSVGEVPAKSTIVDFHCESCGQIISVPQVHAGKKCKCPKCKSIVAVPTLKQIPAQKDEAPVQPGQEERLFLKRPEAPQEPETEIEVEEAEPVDERRLPWLIDIFLYPTSTPGLIMLGIFVGVPLLINILWMILPIQLSYLFGLVTIVINIFIFFYIYWYFAECVRDSADGGGASS